MINVNKEQGLQGYDIFISLKYCQSLIYFNVKYISINET